MNCAEVYNLFFQTGEVTEIRAYGCRGKNVGWSGWTTNIVYGYFDNAEAFGKAAMALERAKAPGIYFTLNPVIPDLLARAANRLKAADAKSSSTSDTDIACIRWLPIDLDPRRPSGISSTDDELAAAVRIRERIRKWLEGEMGWPAKDRIRAHSGNGTHLLYPMGDLSNTPATTQLIKDYLAAISAKFENEWVDIDLKVYNPSRIWKLYGTTARKGDHTEARPHRKSYVE